MQICMKLTPKARRNLSDAIAERQRELGLSHSQIAENTTVDPSQVSRICRGQFKIASANLMQICAFLGVSGIELLLQQQVTGDHRHRLERGIVAIWDRTPEDAQRILKLLRHLAEFRRPS
jgi:transcriptional regulator with XRE-family HTH domain